MCAASNDGREAGARILIVEDNAVIAEDLCELLAEWGYSVVSIVRNGTEALATLRNEKADLVLMDIDFRGRRAGVTATIRIQQEIGVPVVYVSGCVHDNLAPTLVITQPHGFVSKPIDYAYLAVVIRRVLRGRGSLGTSR
jgi:CheY-like chemotaxis protein